MDGERETSDVCRVTLVQYKQAPGAASGMQIIKFGVTVDDKVW